MSTAEATPKQRRKIDWRAEAWNTAYHGGMTPAIAKRVWDHTFTDAERRYLGNDQEAAYYAYGRAIGMWMRLHGVSQQRAVVAVAVACNLLLPAVGEALLRECGEIPEEPHELVEWAVADGGLVLVAEPRQIFWRGTEIKTDWSNSHDVWDFMWALAQRSKAGSVVDAHVLGREKSKDPHPVKKIKYRTTKVLGTGNGLANEIKSVGGAYKLMIPAQEIRIFEIGAGEALREWIP